MENSDHLSSAVSQAIYRIGSLMAPLPT